MAVRIKQLGIDVPGKVIRTYDNDADSTTLLFDEEQIRHLHEQLGPVIDFFDGQNEAGLTTGSP